MLRMASHSEGEFAGLILSSIMHHRYLLSVIIEMSVV